MITGPRRPGRVYVVHLLELFAVFSMISAAVFYVPAQRAVSSGDRSTRKSQDREREQKKRENFRFNAAANRRAQMGKTVVPAMAYHGISESLAVLASRPQPEISKENGPLNELKTEKLFEEPTKPQVDLLPEFLQTTQGPMFSATVGTSFDSIVAAGSAPPDTTMAVGPNHIIVWVNSRYAIYNKSGTLLLGPVNGNTLFAGVGGVCETTNRGDPILQYDRLADRWILSQFAFNVTGPNPSQPYLQCFAISTSNDPTGTYFRYTVTFSPTSPSGFNDYGKLGVWPDAYYTSYNMFGGSPAGGNTGAGLCASDRTKMLAGDATATTLCAPIAFYAGGAAFLPADLDGTTLPTDVTQGGMFIRQSTAPALRILKLKPNFVAGTVTLTDGFGGAAGSFINIPLPATNRACNGSGGTCVAQPGTTNTLDTLGDRLMYRAAYRNRGLTDSLVVNQSVDPDGAGARSSAVRWYEIRSPLSATPTLFQNSTFDQGGTGDRWMGSIAMNQDGDMMMGYSIVNSATGLKPSIALTGRRLSDTVNTMQTESIVFTGTGSQTGGLTRWGDYTTIQVDPSDDQGFCFIGQYLLADGSFNWRTRVICAKFPVVTAAGVSISGRVLSADGNAIRGATVSLIDMNGAIRTAFTNSFGYYHLDDIEAGQVYVIQVKAKGYVFRPISLSITDEIQNLDVFADPSGKQ
jgi:hypothetical protein